METLLGFGVPTWPKIGRSYDWWPLVLPVVAIAAAVWPFRVRLTARSVAALVIGGTMTAWLADPIGLLPAIALGTLALAMGAGLATRRPRPRRE